MIHCCSQCSFTAQFESALIMHRQLHHHCPDEDLDLIPDKNNMNFMKKSNTLPPSSFLSPVAKESRIFKLAGRTSSATRLFGKLRARICKSKTLFSHPEENMDCTINNNDISVLSEGTSKAQGSPPQSRCSTLTTCIQDPLKETYRCHLCSFDADRITVLDRHLLNDHKIGLENLLKLVMAKTKDGLSEEATPDIYGIRRTYYRTPNDIIEEGEFIIETVTPKIKILKHANTNTDLQWSDIPDLKDNCRVITKELEKLMSFPLEKCDKDDFLAKMQVLNDCMCKFVDSSNTLKKMLSKEFDSKHTARDNMSSEQPFFDLSLGDSRDTPRDWGKAHSEKMDRSRNKYAEKCRGDKMYSSESFYF